MDIQEIIESAWSKASQALKTKVRMALQQVSDILMVEDLRSTSHDESHLQRTMGSFANTSFDLSAVSKVLEKRAQKSSLDEATKARVLKIRTSLEQWDRDFLQKLPACKLTSETTLSVVESQAVAHLNAMADCFKLIRMAWLERNSKYTPSVHDAFFADFSWENLSNEEVALCPPFVVMVPEQDSRDFYFSTLLPLVTSGLPIKVILEKKHFHNAYQTFSRSTALRCALEVEMLPVALKGVYVLQDTVARPQAIEHLKAGLVSPRPGIFSILSDSDLQRCEQAVLARAFPLFRYDPDKSEVFLKRFDLSENPELQAIWPSVDFEYVNGNGKKDRLQKKMTFADFAATEAAYQADFSTLPPNQDAQAIELADYLELPSAERSGKIPFLYALGAGNTLVKKVPAMKIVAQSADKRHLWKSLCEVAGVNNPYFTELERQIRAQAAQELSVALEKQKNELLVAQEQQQRDAVATAMKNLASRLAGMSGLELHQVAGVEKQSKPSATNTNAKPVVQNAVSADSDTAYIETKLCTGCDECITIDKNIFAYNGNKQAYIKDPKGGPYKNLLKAAKKCSAQIIHPGKEPK